MKSKARSELAQIFAERAKAIYREHCTDALVEAFVEYCCISYSEMSALDIVYSQPFYLPAYAFHSLCSPDMLLNRKEFPIGIEYGDRDLLGSEGADWVIKTNAFFHSGESQLFRVPNAGHHIT